MKFKKVIESKVRCNKKLQPGRQSFVALNKGVKGFRAMVISIASDTRIDRLSEGGSGFSYEAKCDN